MSDLSRSINDLGCIFLTFVEDLVTKGILDRWVVTFNKMALTVLYSQRRFAFNTISKRSDSSGLRLVPGMKRNH